MPKFKIHISKFAVFLFWSSCINAGLATGAELSFAALKICKKSPVSVPNELFHKHYKIYTAFGDWKIFDINGDGWCDWIRGGHEGYRTDIDSPPMRDFIYLGTPNGWRYFDKNEIGEMSQGDIDDDKKEKVLSKDYNALNFYQPLAIYKNGDIKPYIVSVIRYDAPAPPPNRENINVYQWDDRIDKLRKVSSGNRNLIINFLHDQLCKNPPALMDGDGPFIITMGDLCTPRN